MQSKSAGNVDIIYEWKCSSRKKNDHKIFNLICKENCKENKLEDVAAATAFWQLRWQIKYFRNFLDKVW